VCVCGRAGSESFNFSEKPKHFLGCRLTPCQFDTCS